MPGGPDCYRCYRRGPKTWREMGVSERKRWYREQQSREIRGLMPLRKP